ncbi:hypothetical protein HJC23_011640 [Cyclotella cryptica]|uniref:Uncharacterized protein n=1 Tax=Cyclotella cryptica TaxID=29204 RepID=A0ABD3QSD1_9STRA|eukprot:CCRYP_002784-RA/>CCRYP_002784-RA protein AED:0.28 eAED:0.28 QI:0/-1/0/1/-1/1/1/0/950
MKRHGSQEVSATVNSIRDDQVQHRNRSSAATTQQHENKKRVDFSANSNHNANGSNRPAGKPMMNTKTPSASAPTPPKEAESQTVPHVVRVTFLGVAGILASPLSASTQTSHPALLFPEPEALRVVAAVSRTRTARGIPTGMSGSLERPKREYAAQHGGVAASSEMGSKSELAAGLAGGKSHVALDANHAVAAANNNYNSAAVNPTPPSRLMHARTNSHTGREGVAITGGKLDASTPAATSMATTTNARCSSFSLKLDETQGSIEITASADVVIDPNHSIEGTVRPENVESSENIYQSETCDTGATLNNNNSTAMVNDEQDTLPERYVAIWEQDAPRRKEANAITQSKTNTLAFEAELHPSSRKKTPTKERNRKSFGSFAPKTFCVTIGLVPDDTANGKDRDSTVDQKDADGKNSGSSNISTDSNLPTFAIPIGFANLVITGEETLDGQPLQLDLPLTSVNHFIGNFGNNDNSSSVTPSRDGQLNDFPFPLLELGNGDDTKASSQPAREKSKVDDEQRDKPSDNSNDASNKSTSKHKPLKKSMVSRIFSRGKHVSNKATNATTSVQQTIPHHSHKVCPGQPLSIFQLGRPPNTKEMTMFLERYNIDPSGDAVIRISIEVFQRGSELERVFRQRNRMRREQRRREAAAAATGTDSFCIGVPPNSHRDVERTSSSGTGRSLVDDEDLMESDSTSEETQSYFSLDSERSGTTWDESTFYTYETFGSYYSETDTSYSSEFMTDSIVERGTRPQNSVFGRMFDCKLDGVDEDNPRNNPTASKQNFPIQLQSILNLNCAGGGPSRQHDLYEYNVPRGLVPPTPTSGSVVSNSTPMASHDARRVSNRGGMKVGRQGRTSVADDHHSECAGNEITLETSMEQASDHPSRYIDRTYTVGTVGNEESPMALIVQRAPQAVNLKDRAQSSETFLSDIPAGQSHDEAEGLELTLEEVSHQRSL